VGRRIAPKPRAEALKSSCPNFRYCILFSYILVLSAFSRSDFLDRINRIYRIFFLIYRSNTVGAGFYPVNLVNPVEKKG
jgi:hypothetical protein